MEHFRALAVFAEPPAPEHRRLAEVLGLAAAPTPEEYSDLFVFQLYPYASVYLGAEGMLGGEARDRIAGFWRVLGLRPPGEPDHLAVLLALHARLAELEEAESDGERRAAWRQARHAHLWEHLMSWLPAWLAKLDEIAPEPYRAWGRVFREALVAEAASVGPPAALPLHLRAAPRLADPRREGADAFLASLVAPVRSGMILTRSDLARAAHGLGLGLRAGERGFALRALFAQDAPLVVRWLYHEARRWAQRHEDQGAGAPEFTRFWAGRALVTASLLLELDTDRSEEVARAVGSGD